MAEPLRYLCADETGRIIGTASLSDLQMVEPNEEITGDTHYLALTEGGHVTAVLRQSSGITESTDAQTGQTTISNIPYPAIVNVDGPFKAQAYVEEPSLVLDFDEIGVYQIEVTPDNPKYLAYTTEVTIQ